MKPDCRCFETYEEKYRRLCQENYELRQQIAQLNASSAAEIARSHSLQSRLSHILCVARGDV